MKNLTCAISIKRWFVFISLKRRISHLKDDEAPRLIQKPQRGLKSSQLSGRLATVDIIEYDDHIISAISLKITRYPASELQRV